MNEHPTCSVISKGHEIPDPRAFAQRLSHHSGGPVYWHTGSAKELQNVLILSVFTRHCLCLFRMRHQLPFSPGFLWRPSASGWFHAHFGFSVQIYRILGKTVVCYPIIFDLSDFYMSQDVLLLIDDIKVHLLMGTGLISPCGPGAQCEL